jgi:DNA-binding HxlR family transcriptional regulator
MRSATDYWWSMLIIREALFGVPNRFGEFQKRLGWPRHSHCAAAALAGSRAF